MQSFSSKFTSNEIERILDKGNTLSGNLVVTLDDELYNSSNPMKLISRKSLQETTSLPFECTSGIGSSAIEFNDELHYVGINGHYKYNGEAWTQVSTLPFSSMADCTSCVFKNEIHLIVLVSNDTSSQHQHYKYNFETQEWTSVSKFSYMRWGFLLVYNDKLHFMRYDSSSTNYNGHLIFNEDTRTWSKVSNTGGDGIFAVWKNTLYRVFTADNYKGGTLTCQAYIDNTWVTKATWTHTYSATNSSSKVSHNLMLCPDKDYMYIFGIASSNLSSVLNGTSNMGIFDGETLIVEKGPELRYWPIKAIYKKCLHLFGNSYSSASSSTLSRHSHYAPYEYYILSDNIDKILKCTN